MVHPNSLANLKPIQPGETRNPGGRAINPRNRLQTKFLYDLAKDFDEHGTQAIVEMREKDPSGYIKAIVALMPKEIEINKGLDELTDEQLNAALLAARALLAAADPGAGAGQAQEPQPASGLQAISEAG